MSGEDSSKGKLSASYFDRLFRHQTRMEAIDRLREKYQLSIAECIGASPEVVRERQRRYHEHLDRLKKVWKEEDEEEAKKAT